jgi:hypothetical protein
MTYARWVYPSFKEILIAACDEYVASNDRGNDKQRSNLIARVARDIADVPLKKEEVVPDDLEKVFIPLVF